MRKRRTSEEIRCRLLEAARTQFAAKGYVGATTAAIASQAEMAEVQLFRYYPSKEALFRAAVFHTLIDHFRAFNAQHAPTATDTNLIREHARQYVSELQVFLGEHAKLLSSLFAKSYPAPERQEWDLDRLSLQSYFEECAVLMSERAGSITLSDPNKVVRVAFAALLGCITYRDWMYPDWPADEAELDRIIREFILAGIGPHTDLRLASSPARSN